MRIGIGVSTGTEVVCAAMVVEDDNGSRSVEYRTVSADNSVNTDVGDLVASAVDLVLALAPPPNGVGAHAGERRHPDAIAISHRTEEQAVSIRSALAHSTRDIVLVPESAAAHAFLDDSGSIARYRTVSIVDFGATGTTVSVVDAQTGDVRHIDRTSDLTGAAAARAATSEVAVLIGGRANISSVRATTEAALTVPVIVPAEPDTVLAQGAALLALHSPVGRFPTVGEGIGSGARSFGRYGSALAGALLVGGIVLAYGIQTLTPSDDSGFSPAGSVAPTSEQTDFANAPIGDDGRNRVPVGTSARTTTAVEDKSSGRVPPNTSSDSSHSTATRTSTTPSLHPAPDLPAIPWPADPAPSTTTRPDPRPATTPGGEVVRPPTDEPGVTVTTPPVTTPPVITPEPATEIPGPSTELGPTPSESAGIPTTVVGATTTAPGLTPPPTVWTPPPSGGSSDGTESENTAPRAENTAPRAENSRSRVPESEAPARPS